MKLKVVPHTDKDGKVTLELVDIETGSRLENVRTIEFSEGAEDATMVTISFYPTDDKGLKYGFFSVDTATLVDNAGNSYMAHEVDRSSFEDK